ncbi:phosphoribosylanthranilate isomerase [Algoriphagus sp.]|uniref:phosphoribosylanthranilate isomerase n=1 Tax=Algoriphagus sp. TaxID=1872435 RepID=UPI00391D841B
MALTTFVKINSVTNLTDARYGAGMYVDLLGFNLDRTAQNYISPEQFKEISGWVSGVDFVGEFSHETNPAILEILKNYPAINGIEYDRIEPLKAFVGKGYTLLYKMNLEEVRQIEPEVSNMLAESGIIFHIVSLEEVLSQDDLEVIKKLAKNCRVLLGTGINPENVQKLVDELGIIGISLSGSDEIKPGLKDMDQLSEILEKLEKED